MRLRTEVFMRRRQLTIRIDEPNPCSPSKRQGALHSIDGCLNNAMLYPCILSLRRWRYTLRSMIHCQHNLSLSLLAGQKNLTQMATPEYHKPAIFLVRVWDILASEGRSVSSVTQQPPDVIRSVVRLLPERFCGASRSNTQKLYGRPKSRTGGHAKQHLASALGPHCVQRPSLLAAKVAGCSILRRRRSQSTK